MYLMRFDTRRGCLLVNDFRTKNEKTAWRTDSVVREMQSTRLQTGARPMNPKAQQIRQRVTDTAREHENATAAVERLERDCEHNRDQSLFTPPKYDPPGTMGIDRQLPCSWPETRDDQWTRVCTQCGKIEKTRQSRDLPVKKEPVFGRGW